MARKKNRKNRKKNSRPTVVTDAEPASTSPTLNKNANVEDIRPQIDGVLQAECITEGVKMLLELQQMRITSLVRTNNANQSLGGEMVKLVKENADLKQQNEEQKEQIIAWRQENASLKTAMVWAEAKRCTHFDKRLFAQLYGIRCHVINDTDKQIVLRLEEIERSVEDPVQRQNIQEGFLETIEPLMQDLMHMKFIAKQVESKQNLGATLQDTST
ncbi:hypothetical protein EJ07DRAFT_180941 [Lizonia empirigonia]|nr:hypothetical protein EJ07DRAFT_180941 [Lizonia empirigonia]